MFQDPSWTCLWAMPEPHSLQWDVISTVFVVTKLQTTLSPGPAQPASMRTQPLTLMWREKHPPKRQNWNPTEFNSKTPQRSLQTLRGGGPWGAPLPAGC